jgi:hypothetical protein
MGKKNKNRNRATTDSPVNIQTGLSQDGRGAIIQFSAPISWVAFEPRKARQIAISLLMLADQIESPPAAAAAPADTVVPIRRDM